MHKSKCQAELKKQTHHCRQFWVFQMQIISPSNGWEIQFLFGSPLNRNSKICEQTLVFRLGVQNGNMDPTPLLFLCGATLLTSCACIDIRMCMCIELAHAFVANDAGMANAGPLGTMEIINHMACRCICSQCAAQGPPMLEVWSTNAGPMRRAGSTQSARRSFLLH